MISLRTDSTLLDIEDLYSELHGTDAVDVRLPSHLKHGGTFGISSAIVQFVATWGRANQKGKLSPYGAGNGVESFAELLHQPHGLIASYMAPNLEAPQGSEFEKHEVLAQAAPYIEAMQSSRFRETMNGRGALLACFAGAKNEFLLPLYERKNLEGMRGAGDFENLTRKLMEVCDPTVLRNMPDTFVQSLGLLIRELFENTNDHASTDEQGRDYSWHYPNVRAVLAKYIAFTPGAKDAINAFDDVPHRLYFQKAMLKANADKTLDFIELSVFDCGPGIAKRWLAHVNPHENIENVSIDKEEELVRETFELGKTSKPINGTGVGLYTVIKSLGRLKALLRLRTGRLCLYQDFSSGADTAFEPRHWLNERKELPRTVGTSFSILIPLASRGQS
jgi:hypothetical protein